MLSVSSSSSTPIFGWPLEETTFNYSMNHGFYDHSNQQVETAAVTGYIDHPVNFAPGEDQNQVEGTIGDAKKVNHNASERYRRKKINELYSSLRSLLPASEQSRRMSIPTTIAKVLKYIPELQQEVEKIEKKKLTMSKNIHHNQEPVNPPSFIQDLNITNKKLTKGSKVNNFQEKVNLSSVLISNVGDSEAVIQMSASRISVPEIFMSLEEDGFQLISSFSSSEPFGGWVFLNLRLQKPFGIEKNECDLMDQKILSILGNK